MVKKDDANTSYFHAWVKIRKRINFIVAVNRERNGWKCLVRLEVKLWVFSRSKSIHWVRSTFDRVDFPCLSVEQSRRLSKEFLDIEIGEAAELLDGNKSQILDEFDYAFFKEIWGTKKNLHSYFITLIPKVHNPHYIDEFRLISLLGSLYKYLLKCWQRRYEWS